MEENAQRLTSYAEEKRIDNDDIEKITEAFSLDIASDIKEIKQILTVFGASLHIEKAEDVFAAKTASYLLCFKEDILKEKYPSEYEDDVWIILNNIMIKVSDAFDFSSIEVAEMFYATREKINQIVKEGGAFYDAAVCYLQDVFSGEYNINDEVSGNAAPSFVADVFKRLTNDTMDYLSIDARKMSNVKTRKELLSAAIKEKAEQEKKKNSKNEDKSPADIAQEKWEAERERLKKAIADAAEKRNSIAKELRETDDKNDNAKFRRLIYVFLFYFVIFCIIFYKAIGKVKWDLGFVICGLLGSSMAAFFCLLVNLNIFTYVTTKAREGDNHVKYIAKEFEEATKELERKIEEKKRFEEKPPYSK